MINEKNDGYILITVLLLLLVLTVLGIAAIHTSTIDNALTGNVRLRERNLAKADGGVEISIGLIERAVRERNLTGFADIVFPVFAATSNDYLPTELNVTPFDPDVQDLSFQIDSRVVIVDIDKMYSIPIPGSAREFAAGYDGLSGLYTYYRINATGTDLVSSTADVGTIYRYVPK